MKFRPAAMLFLFAATSLLLYPTQASAATDKPKVVIISLDAFGAATLQDPTIAAPTLHALMKNGAYAKSMRPINPTVTWPNHTAIITGQDASRHHVLVNGLIVDQRTDHAPRVDAKAAKTQLVAVPTLYDIAHAAGYTTAHVDWVAIAHAPTIDWEFSELPDPDGQLSRELIADGKTTRDDLAAFSKHVGAWRDRIFADAAVDVLRKHHPDLLLVHFLSLDTIQHATGFGTEADYNTVAFLDDRVAQIVNAVRDNGDLDRTTFIIVADHGQQSFHQWMHPNVPLIKTGLQGPTSTKPTFALADGGFSLVFQKNATPASIADLKKLYTGMPGILSALTQQEAVAMGWPQPDTTNQAADLLLYAADDYAFSPLPSDDFITTTEQRGTHGYPNTFPLMQAIFIASGADIKSVGEIPSMLNLDVAPTVARIMHLYLPNTQGHALTEILK